MRLIVSSIHHFPTHAILIEAKAKELESYKLKKRSIFTLHSSGHILEDNA